MRLSTLPPREAWILRPMDWRWWFVVDSPVDSPVGGGGGDHDDRRTTRETGRVGWQKEGQGWMGM